ncbi:response regulator [Microvirga pudoricolor]|uniref:response regulator n=1 Tax=Microvirga pudoricolor TaxID=2778729 RepID=UPI001951C084|nr:response regulator [Microvirga pudoricolor]MBM6595685.1 response regulator [Microvirga pudoricolor]
MGQAVKQPRVALIVEDEDEVRDLAAALLEETDLEVVETENTQEAMNYLSGNAGDVAFLFADVRTSSRLDGVDLARTVRLKWPWVRVVLTSGAPLDDDLDKGLRNVRFIPKPWRALDVLMEAEKALAHHS